MGVPDAAMTADVYAGDVNLRDGPRSFAPAGCATFTLVADADPDLVLRVGSILNLLNVTPRGFHLEAGPGGLVSVRACVECAEFQAELVARKLERLTSVRDVNLEYAPARA
jgi:hypothetical protein